MRVETACVQAGYKSGNGEPGVMPIYQSTTFTYDSAEAFGRLFDLTDEGHIYSRISNPTLAYVEEKIAALEGGVGAMLTSSGQAATLIAILNLCSAGDHMVSAGSIYGGTINLIAVTLKRLGIDVTFVDQDATDEKIIEAFQPNTKLVFAETIANPALKVLDIEKMARIAHSQGVPLILDNTFPTPILCRPFEFGADVIVHSTTKYFDGHAGTIGGCIVDSGNFNYDNGKFTGLSEPDKSYHGVTYTRDFGKTAYITKARVQLMRDFGAIQSPLCAFLINLGLESLHVRMERHSQNALSVAEYLQQHNQVEWVTYPGLKTDKCYALAQKYLPNGASGVVSFGIKGGREEAIRFMDKLKMIKLVVHVADVRTCVLHPATTTHRQVSDEGLVAAGITPNLIRVSVGIEHIDDIIADIEQALN